ncbi:fatty acid desaturase [Amylibacter sp. SFDW26]|uniref:fatty acid desaturase n=1 Tax=Amylibacter sp. SFDW26 TaxID=2652722 RepID=UPI0012627F14|nr:fatty acid desaturase [Amylibacter sp. SFDW26]
MSRFIPSRAYEWPTLILLCITYLLWGCFTYYASTLGSILTILCLAPIITLHSSLQHETLHIIEPKSKLLGQSLVFPAIGFFIPYIRFRDTHLAHHVNEYLTDPYDDPESYYLCKTIWATQPRWVQKVLTFNNTLIGRILIGPCIGQIAFMHQDFKAILKGDTSILKAWLIHAISVACVLWGLLTYTTIGMGTYILACYCGLSILKIRTYLEHRAHENMNDRSVIIEDRGLLSFLFLNNNYHAAHHAQPQIPWYNLPLFFNENRSKFINKKHNYSYPNYKTIFSKYMFQAKETVPHPLWSIENRNDR